MNKRELLIILKAFPFDDRTFYALSKFYGKIEIVLARPPRFQQIIAGTLISCFLNKKNSRLFTGSSVEIVFYPLCRHVDHLVFFHQLLEFCYYFLPLHSPSPEVFLMLYKLFTFFTTLDALDFHFQAVQKIAILKLLALFGFYPEAHLVKYIHMFDQSIMPYIDLSQGEKVRFENPILATFSEIPTQSIDKWILECINTHPCKSKFKTVLF